MSLSHLYLAFICLRIPVSLVIGIISAFDDETFNGADANVYSGGVMYQSSESCSFLFIFLKQLINLMSPRL